MGPQLLAIVPHDFRSVEDVLRLPEVVRPLTGEANAFERLCSEYRGGDGIPPELRKPVVPLCVEEWKWGWYQEEATPEQDLAKYGCAWLDGPATICVGARSLFVQPSANWHWVRTAPRLLAGARSLFEAAARTLGARCYLCTHDDETGVWDYVIGGLGLEGIEEKLKDRGFMGAGTMDHFYVSSPEAADYVRDVYCLVRV